MKKLLAALLIPPVGACQYGSGTHCTAPVSVFWIFGIISIVYGILGGPAAEAGISWYTVSLGFLMWGIAALWAYLTQRGVEADSQHRSWSPLDHKIAADDHEVDPFDEIKKAH